MMGGIHCCTACVAHPSKGAYSLTELLLDDYQPPVEDQLPPADNPSSVAVSKPGQQALSDSSAGALDLASGPHHHQQAGSQTEYTSWMPQSCLLLLSPCQFRHQLLLQLHYTAATKCCNAGYRVNAAGCHMGTDCLAKYSAVLSQIRFLNECSVS